MPTAATAQWTYQMLENESLWQTTRRAHDLLAGAMIPHAIVGGVAVCLHGYRRNTVDLDLLVRLEDASAIRTCLEADGFSWHAANKEFRSPSGIAIQFVIAGDREGPGQEAAFPDPAEPRTIALIEDLPALALAHLIQAKIACGLGSPRRTHKDLAEAKKGVGSRF